jgi:GntR family transcriptional regulator, transcriptional repressor for pyruvate dehydrogenase complex
MSTMRVMPMDYTTFAPVHGPVSRYRQLAQFISAGIKDGKLSPGDPLPSETQLADYANVSVDTVRSALAVLREQGVIVTSQGIGSFVAGH